MQYTQQAHLDELERIKLQIVKRYQPQQVILFGSLARGVIHKDSDIDLCIIIDTKDKRQIARDILLYVDSDKPFDVIVYTPEEWSRYQTDPASMAYSLCKEGKVIYYD